MVVYLDYTGFGDSCKGGFVCDVNVTATCRGRIYPSRGCLVLSLAVLYLAVLYWRAFVPRDG